MPYPNDFAPPVTGQPAPFATSPTQPTNSTSDAAPPTGQSPDKADPTDTDTDVDATLLAEGFQNADVAVAATAMPGTLVVTCPAFTPASGAKYEVCFFAPRVERTTVTGSANACKITLVEGGSTNNDPWARVLVGASVSGGCPVFLRSRFVGSGGPRNYTVVAYNSFTNEFTIGTGGDQIQIYARLIA